MQNNYTVVLIPSFNSEHLDRLPKIDLPRY